MKSKSCSRWDEETRERIELHECMLYMRYMSMHAYTRHLPDVHFLAIVGLADNIEIHDDGLVHMPSCERVRYSHLRAREGLLSGAPAGAINGSAAHLPTAEAVEADHPKLAQLVAKRRLLEVLEHLRRRVRASQISRGHSEQERCNRRMQ